MLDDKDEFVSSTISLGEINNVLRMLQFVDTPEAADFVRQLKKIRFERFGVPHTEPLF